MPTFCDRCGAPLGADDQRCRTCGWPVSAAPPPGREEPAAGPSTQRLDEPPAASGPAEPDDADVATRVQRPVDPEPTAAVPPAAPSAPTAPVPQPQQPQQPPAASPYARPTTSASGGDDDPYAGWFVDDPQPPAAAEPAAGWTSYDERGWQQYEDDPRLPPPLREDEPLDLDGGARRSGTGRVLGALAVGALVVLVGLAAVYFGVLRHDGGTPTAGTTPSAGATPPPGSSVSSPPAGGASSAPSSTATSTSPYPPVSLTGKECGGSGTGPWAKAAAGNTATSCPFALAVQQAWLATNPQAGDSRTVDATSPVTNKTYPMTCSGDQPVTCKGGNGAVVFLYGGTATFG